MPSFFDVKQAPPPEPVFPISGLSKQEKIRISSAVGGERDALFRRVFITGNAAVFPNLIIQELWNHSMSVADYSQEHAPTLGPIAGAIGIQEMADNIARLDTARNIEGIEHLGHASSEWHAERLGVYERILTAVRNNAFTEDEFEVLEDLIPYYVVPDICERFTGSLRR